MAGIISMDFKKKRIKDMNKKYKLAIFDMDGTILNTLEDLTDSVNYALSVHSMPLRTRAEVRQFVGNGIRRALEQAVPNGTSEEELEQVVDTFTGYYKLHCADKTQPYDGICEVIRKLRQAGVKTAVVSNKADFAVQQLCKDYFDGLFDYAVGEKAGARRKPYPDSVLDVFGYFQMAKEDAVYIGDSEVDFLTAKNAKTDVIMVGWGFRDEDFLMECGADDVIQNPDEIVKKIMEE